MFNYRTLSFYIFQLYYRSFGIISGILVGMLLLSNAFDILQRFKSTYIPSSLFWRLMLYKIPYLINEISVLISFIAMLFFLRRITKYNELVIILCNGIPLWRLLLIPIMATLLLGIFIITVINPLGIYGLMKYEQIETKLTKRKYNNLTISQFGIFFFEEYDNSNRIIQTKSLNPTTHEMHDVIMLFVDDRNRFIKRIDAPHVKLDNNVFQLTEPKVITNNTTEAYVNLVIPTSLSMNSLINSFISPEMISFWELPTVINTLLKAGLPVVNYQLHYYKQLFKPLMMAATAILSCCFLSLRTRDNSHKKMVVNGILLGFTSYAAMEIILRILAYNGLKPLLAVLLPICLMIFIGSFIILHLYEA
ncbi:LptF/LptG family permease [Candidatus Trichorickettsia mobilis]|nr:LptF/LptG family permease [Candidatus Trichorickettsia mobilis]